jgi:hypothetical protein
MSDSGPGRREVAYRLFATEFDDAEFSYSESDEERAPNYVVTPTGARVNRLFAVGVLTEVDDVNPEMVRGRIVDPTGAFVSYAGQYQPDALAFLERAEPPTFVALSGKARTFEPEDGDRIYTSVRPESINEVDADTRDRLVVIAADRTLNRIGVMASAIEAELSGDQLRAALAEEGVDDRLADGVALALDYYGTTPAYLAALRETALDAVRVVAGERDDVRRLEVAPDEGVGDASASDLATLDLSGAPSPASAAAAASIAESKAESAEPESEAEPETETETETEPEQEPGTEEPSEVEAEAPATESEPEEEPEPETEPEPEAESEPEPEPGETEATSEAEPEAETVEEPGEFEADEAAREEVEEELEDFDPGEFDLDEETREQVEEEYGTEFSTADEVEEAGIETPEPEAESETEVEPEVEEPDEPEPLEEESEAEEFEEVAEEADEEPEVAAGEVDLEDAVMETMEDLDEGDGADREELVAAIVDAHGVAAEEVEAAIQDALMSGRCYEPSDGTLKSI